MVEKHISFTALMTAYLRGHHTMHDRPVIFYDTLSYQLIPDERRQLIAQALRQAAVSTHASESLQAEPIVSLSPLLQTMGLPNVVTRARYTEGAMLAAIEQDVTQYVILGAGLDTFVFRYADQLPRKSVIEVDLPGMQAFKQRRIAELGWSIPESVHFIPADLSRDRVADVLRSTAYTPHSPAVFSMLGLTMYLPPTAVFDTLRSIRDVAPAGSTVIFDYHTTTLEILRALRQELESRAEGMNTTFEPPQLAIDLAQLGFRVEEDMGPQDIDARYFAHTESAYHANENVHLIRAVVL